MSNTDNTIPRKGEPAPAFSLSAHTGEEVSLKDLRGRPVIVYFYPKDDTPGCTIEAKGFQEQAAAFDDSGAVVLGISPDSIQSHCKFAEKYSLGYKLLADEDHQVCEKYGVWVEKNNYGKRYWGVQRATFLIDRDGRIAQVWPKVKPDGHAEEVLEAAHSLES